MEHIEDWFDHYGYLVLFLGLIADFVLPFPAEPVMAYAGYLSSVHVMHWFPSMLVAFLGASIAVTISYFIGYALGMPFIERYGKWLFLKPAMVDKTGKWFDKYGYKLLLISFFIPAGRQFSGYFAGILRIPFRNFVFYSYTGALLWAVAYVGLGFLLGSHWNEVLALVKTYCGVVGIAAAVIAAGWLVIRKLPKKPGKVNRPVDSDE